MDPIEPFSPRSQATPALEAFAYSSALAGAVAGALVIAVETALRLPGDLRLAALAAAGTIAVYNVDRLRDTARDRGDSPSRTAFVERNATALRVLLGVSLAVCAVSASRLDAVGFAICAAVLALGLGHRRLKRVRGIKTFYLVVSWAAITILLPVYGVGLDSAPVPSTVAWIGWIVIPTLTANMLASNLERAGGEVAPTPRAKRRKLSIAVACAGLGLASAIVAPPLLHPLGATAAAEFVALVRFRDSERYRAVVVDGALLLGALASIAWSVLVR